MGDLMKNNCIKLYRNDGKFVYAYNEDAYIIHSIFNYKLLREGNKDKCGFPYTVMDKVIEKLEELNISYEIYYKNVREKDKDYKRKNSYCLYYEDSLLQVEIDKKIDLIKYKLERLDKKELNKKIENILNII